jgi:hypothetical protein
MSISVFSVVYFSIDVARGEQTIADTPSERPKNQISALYAASGPRGPPVRQRSAPKSINQARTYRGNNADDGAAAESMRPSDLAVPVA